MISVDLAPAGPRARGRRRPRGSRACRPASSARDLESQLNARGWTFGHFPDSLHALDARRLDRHALVGHAVRPLRRHRRPHARRCAWSRPSGCWSRARCRAPRPARACARWCSAARAGWGSSREATVHVRRAAARAHDPRLPVPDLGRVGLAAMRDIAASEAAPSVTRVSDAYETAFSFATTKAPDAARPLKSRGAAGRSCSAARASTSSEMCLSFIGYEGPRAHVAAQRKLVGRIVARHGGLCIGRARASSTTRRSSTRPTSATSCSTAARSPTCRRPRRRGASCRTVYDNVMAAGARRASTSSASAATSCATCRTPTTRARACTSRSRSSRRAGATSRWRSTAW